MISDRSPPHVRPLDSPGNNSVYPARMSAPVTIAAFYRFAPLTGLPQLRSALHELCAANAVFGSLLIAYEGINGTLAGSAADMEIVLGGITSITGIADISPKFSHAGTPPFKRLKVRIKQEIITFGQVDADPAQRAGTYVAPQDWNALIADPDVLLIDARNAYEVAAGTFCGAQNPGTQTFSEFPAYVHAALDPARHRKVAMFCTGGIRCEKASSYMLGAGFAEVYHLQGGILKYLEEVPEDTSQWQGGCFVFDERVTVGHGLTVLPLRCCISCDAPLTRDVLQAEGFEDGVSCPACVARLSPAQKASARERQRQVDLARARGRQHIGPRAMAAKA